MCRLLIGTSSAIKAYDSAHGLVSLLQYLEKRCGGHGNGVSLHQGKVVVATQKGRDFTVEEAALMLLEESRRYDFAIFHTRVASVGFVSDALCHPYISGDDALAMNGTLLEFKGVAEALVTTDTEVVFNLIKGLAPLKTIKVLTALEAVFVGSVRGKPYAVKQGGDLEEWRPKSLKDSDFLFASEFPLAVFNTKDLPYAFSFLDGERETIQSNNINISPSCYSCSSSWDD